MNSYSIWQRYCLAIAFVVISALAADAQTAADFAGQWVFKLGTRNLMVLTLTPAQAGPLTGTLIRPSFKTVDGVTYSAISNTRQTELVTHSEFKEGNLLFSTQNAQGKNSRTYRASIRDASHLVLTRTSGKSLMEDGNFWEPWELSKVAGTAILATDWDANRVYSLDDYYPSNAEMKRIFDEDQKARETPDDKLLPDLSVITGLMKADADRRETVRKLLVKRELHTGEDFENAAFVFQHGDSPEDYLLAHTLAMVAVAKGRSGALWIATATLDRFLQKIDRPQVFGTQFSTTSDKPWTQEPYDRALVPDSLRTTLGVHPLAAQENQLKQLEAESKGGPGH